MEGMFVPIFFARSDVNYYQYAHSFLKNCSKMFKCKFDIEALSEGVIELAGRSPCIKDIIKIYIELIKL